MTLGDSEADTEGVVLRLGEALGVPVELRVPLGLGVTVPLGLWLRVPDVVIEPDELGVAVILRVPEELGVELGVGEHSLFLPVTLMPPYGSSAEGERRLHDCPPSDELRSPAAAANPGTG